MKKLNLVLGGNGHLGNNIIRLLVGKEKKTRVGIRNINYKEPLSGLNCEVVYVDILNKKSLLKAMAGVDTLFIAAAANRSWAKNIQREIIDVNVKGTKNILESAIEHGVRKVIYVSSTTVLDNSKIPISEIGWNKDKCVDPYIKSKIKAEKLALGLAKKYNLDMISIIPSAIIGQNCYGHLTLPMWFLEKILKNQIPIDPNFNFNYVDVQDVANAIIVASEKGRKWERYILGQENPINSTEIFRLAHSLYPTVKIPPKVPYFLIYLAGFVVENISKIIKRKPDLTTGIVREKYKADYRLNISKAKRELGFNPKAQKKALKKAFEYIHSRK